MPPRRRPPTSTAPRFAAHRAAAACGPGVAAGVADPDCGGPVERAIAAAPGDAIHDAFVTPSCGVLRRIALVDYNVADFPRSQAGFFLSDPGYDAKDITVLEGLERYAAGPACTSAPPVPRPPPSRLRGGRQQRRRGAAGPLRQHLGHAPSRRPRVTVSRQRPRHPGRRDGRARSARRRGGADQAACAVASSAARATRSPAGCTASASP